MPNRKHIEVDGLERDMRLQLNADPSTIVGAYIQNLELNNSILKDTNTPILIPTIVHVLYKEGGDRPTRFKPTESDLNSIMNELQLLMNNNNMNIHFNVSYNYVNLDNFDNYGDAPLTVPGMTTSDDNMRLDDVKALALDSIPSGNRDYYLHIYLVNSIKGRDAYAQVSDVPAPIHSYNPIVSPGTQFGLTVSMWSLPSLSYLYLEEDLNYGSIGMNHFFRGIGHILGLLNIPTVHALSPNGTDYSYAETVGICPNPNACLFYYTGSNENMSGFTEGDCCNDTGSISLVDALTSNGYLNSNECNNDYLILDNIMHFYPAYGLFTSTGCKITSDQRSRIRSHFDTSKLNGQPTLLTKIGIPITSNVIDLQCNTLGSSLTATSVQESIEGLQETLAITNNIESERMLQAQIAYLYSIINNSTL